MIHRMLRYPAGWEWHVLLQATRPPEELSPMPGRKERTAGQPGLTESSDSLGSQPQPINNEPPGEQLHLLELKRMFPECSSWLDQCADRRTNFIATNERQDDEPILSGTLIVPLSGDSSDTQPLHFWLSRHRLVTAHDDMRVPLRLQMPAHTAQYESCQSAPEAFMLMLGFILEAFHSGMDDFEQRLGQLEQTMRDWNRAGLIDVIFERRYDLLQWNHLFIPIREAQSAAREVFMTPLEKTDAYIRTSHKLERIDALLGHYSGEIDTLISMDRAVSHLRGIHLLKTLTFFTVLFFPAALVVALWNSRLNPLEWKFEPFGIAAMTGLVVVLTTAVYVALRRKGWKDALLEGADRRVFSTGGMPPSRTSRLAGKRKRPAGRSGRAVRSDDGDRGKTASIASEASAPGAGPPLPSRRKRG